MYTKIKSYGMKSLTNSEHYGFHEKAREYFNECVAEKIFITDEMANYEKAIEAEATALGIIRKSALSAELEEKEIERDNLLSYFFSLFDAASMAYMKSVKDARATLSPVVEQYRYTKDIPVSQESAEIELMVENLNKSENVANMTTLNLLTVLAEIERANKEYKALDSQRTSETPSKRETEEVRARVDDAFNAIVDKANAMAILMPNKGDAPITVEHTPEVQTLVSNINNHIDQTRASYNRRMG